MTTSATVTNTSAWSLVLDRARAILPGLLLLTLVVVVALLAGALAGWLVGGALRGLKFDRLSERLGLSAALRRSGLPDSASTWGARLAAGFTVVSVLLVGLASLRIPGTESAFDRGLTYLPVVVATIVILIAGMLLAQFLARATLIAAVNGGVSSARWLASAVRCLVLSLAGAMALDELGVAENVVVAAFSILFGGVVFALAIAFGLGGRHLARRYLESRFEIPPRDQAGAEIDHV